MALWIVLCFRYYSVAAIILVTYILVHTCKFLQGRFIEVDVLSCICAYLTLLDNAMLFSTVAKAIYITADNVWEVLLLSNQTDVKMFAIHGSVKWYLIVVLVCISFFTNEVEHVSYAYWSSDLESLQFFPAKESYVSDLKTPSCPLHERMC